MLFKPHRGRFACGANNHDAVSTLLDMPVNQLAQPAQIEATIFVHRGDEGDETSLKSNARTHISIGG